MKRYSSLLIVFSIMLVFVSASASFAIFPGFGPGVLGDGSAPIQLHQGWWSPVAVTPPLAPYAGVVCQLCHQ